MKLLVGLGNYGSEYVSTRHNIGFMVAEQVAGRFGIALKKKGYQGIYGVGAVASQQTTIILPQTYMNRSGGCVHAASCALKVDPADIVVIYDDLDLPFGRLKISKEGGAGGHNGIRDIISVVGRRDFVRLRFGIGKPEHGDVTRHVLGSFNSVERIGLPTMVGVAADAAELIINGGVDAAMNKFNGYNLEDNL